MPSPKNQYYGISFHPTHDEWNQYRDKFIHEVELYCVKKKYDYLFVEEKGSSKEFTHFQGFIDTVEPIRPDSFKSLIDKALLKDIELSYPSVAFKVSPQKRDIMFCQGYCLKETSLSLSSIAVTSYPIDQILIFKEYYLKQVKLKKTGSDKVKVTRKTLPLIFKRFVELNKYRVDSKPKVAYVLGKMGQDEYNMLPIINSSFFIQDVSYLYEYMNDNLCEWTQDKIYREYGWLVRPDEDEPDYYKILDNPVVTKCHEK